MGKKEFDYFVFPQANEFSEKSQAGNIIPSEKSKSAKMAQHEYEVKARKILLNAGSEFQEKVGRIWRVVGGKKTSGIKVRMNEDIKSAELSSRLSQGSIVEEIDLMGE